MDPRHPELAIDRMDQLMVQFKRVLDTLRTETVASKLGQAEREGSLVVQELCLVAPRLHEAMMQVSRERRGEIARGVATKTVKKSFHRADIITEIEDPYKVEESKPKKKTTKKKTTKKKAE